MVVLVFALLGSLTLARSRDGNEVCSFLPSHFREASLLVHQLPSLSRSPSPPSPLSLSSYAIVTLQATGHFTGKPYSAPAHADWPSLAPTGRRFALAPETAKVKVNNQSGKIEEIAMLPAPGGGPRGRYEALGGKMPSNK